MRKGVDKLLHVAGDLQGCIRKNPEAFFAKKILVCEGATEIGFCRAINNFRISQNHISATCKGVRFADGTGSQMAEYVMGFKNLSYLTALFCDSDDDKINSRKQSFIEAGITLIDCNNSFSIEQQVFNDAPWGAIKELIQVAIKKVEEDRKISHQEAEKAIYDCTNSHLKEKMTSMEGWYEHDNATLRDALGLASKKNEWYKKQSYGEKMGIVILSHYGELPESSKLKKEIDSITKWIEG